MTYKELKAYTFIFGKFKGQSIGEVIDLSEYTPNKWKAVVEFAYYIAWLDENVEWFEDAHAIIDAINERGDKLLEKLKEDFGDDWPLYIGCDASEADIY